MLHTKFVRRSIFYEKAKNTVPKVDVIENVNGEEIVRTFYEKEIRAEEFRVEKVMKKQRDK